MQRFMREKRIYADAAASTPLHPRVIKRMSALMGVYGNPGALHREALMASEELERARREVAETIGAHPDEIIFTGSGTESNNLAIMGVLTADQGSTLVQTKVEPWSAVTLPIEHASVLEPLAHSGLPPARAGGAQAGAKIIQVPVGENGVVSPKDVYEAIMDDTVLVSIQMINSEIGTI
ncbi:MAG TPA: aminotransferase class V-fold PLP-dependent enzyme, partial [Candidatus Paceibacterota bacterium]